MIFISLNTFITVKTCHGQQPASCGEGVVSPVPTPGRKCRRAVQAATTVEPSGRAPLPRERSSGNTRGWSPFPGPPSPLVGSHARAFSEALVSIQEHSADW